MDRPTAKRLLDAQRACLEIQTFTRDMTEAEILVDRRTQLSLHKLVEIVGEALNQASKLDPSLDSRIPPLRRFVNVRNYFVHNYGSVDYSIVWQICTEFIPPLNEQLDEILASAPPLLADDSITENT